MACCSSGRAALDATPFSRRCSHSFVQSAPLDGPAASSWRPSESCGCGDRITDGA
jgi:hypothetical protein